MREKNKALTILTSLIPGTGYMYFGLMKRGFEAATIFFLTLSILLSINGGIPLLGLLIPIWLYTFFDTFNIAKKYDEGIIFKDCFYIFEGKSDFNKLFKNKFNRNLVACFLLVLGIIEILNNLSQGVFWEYPALELTLNITKKVFIPLILIIVSVMIFKNNKYIKNFSKNNTYDVENTISDDAFAKDTYEQERYAKDTYYEASSYKNDVDDTTAFDETILEHTGSYDREEILKNARYKNEIND